MAMPSIRRSLRSSTVGAVAASLLLAACGGGGSGSTETKGPSEGGGQGKAGASAQGKQVFTANGCATCHTLSAADSHGAVGPDLDKTLPGKSEAFIRQSVVDPDAKIAPGYSSGVMPTDFASRLSSAELSALVKFLAQNAGK